MFQDMLPIFLHEELRNYKFDKRTKCNIISNRLKTKEELLWQKQW